MKMTRGFMIAMFAAVMILVAGLYWFVFVSRNADKLPVRGIFVEKEMGGVKQI